MNKLTFNYIIGLEITLKALSNKIIAIIFIYKDPIILEID